MQKAILRNFKRYIKSKLMGHYGIKYFQHDEARFDYEAKDRYFFTTKDLVYSKDGEI